MAELKIYRGTNQIGGCCTEISAGRARFLIDLGANLPDTRVTMEDEELVRQAFLGVDPVAVLFTHLHGDHIGLYRQIPEGVPVYIGPLAKEIIGILTAQLDSFAEKKSAPFVKGMRTYTAGRWLKLAPELAVLPLYVDHSAPDAYMLYIRAAGKKILFTGDFRDHGIQGERGQLWNALQHYVVPHGVDVLITEGTMLSRVEEAKKNPVRTERELGREALERFRAHKYNFVLMSSTNLDSVMQFYHSTPDGMCFVCDPYQAEVMLTAMKGMEKKEPRWYRRSRYQPAIYIWHQSHDDDLSRLEQLGASLAEPLRVLSADARRMARAGFVMLIRQSLPHHHKRALDHFYPLDGSKDSQLIYSLWTGYLQNGSHPDREMLEKLAGRELYPLHTSGHAFVDTIARLVETVDPKVIIPMHTECARKFQELPVFARWMTRVRLLQDGEVFSL